jgi:hypothetical protein
MGTGPPTKRQRHQHDDSRDQESDYSQTNNGFPSHPDFPPAQTHIQLPNRSRSTSVAGSGRPAEKDASHTRILATSADILGSPGLIDRIWGGQEAGGKAEGEGSNLKDQDHSTESNNTMQDGSESGDKMGDGSSSNGKVNSETPDDSPGDSKVDDRMQDSSLPPEHQCIPELEEPVEGSKARSDEPTEPAIDLRDGKLSVVIMPHRLLPADTHMSVYMSRFPAGCPCC